MALLQFLHLTLRGLLDSSSPLSLTQTPSRKERLRSTIRTELSDSNTEERDLTGDLSDNSEESDITGELSDNNEERDVTVELSDNTEERDVTGELSDSNTENRDWSREVSFPLLNIL